MNSRVLLVFALVCVAAAVSMPPQWGKNGGWNVAVDETALMAQVQKKWDVTKDGKVKADVHGRLARIFGGVHRGHWGHTGASIGGSWR